MAYTRTWPKHKRPVCYLTSEMQTHKYEFCLLGITRFIYSSLGSIEESQQILLTAWLGYLVFLQVMAELDLLSTPHNIQISEVTCDSFRIAWETAHEDTVRVTHYFIDLRRKEGGEQNRFKNRVSIYTVILTFRYFLRSTTVHPLSFFQNLIYSYTDRA